MKWEVNIFMSLLYRLFRACQISTRQLEIGELGDESRVADAANNHVGVLGLGQIRVVTSEHESRVVGNVGTLKGDLLDSTLPYLSSP